MKNLLIISTILFFISFTACTTEPFVEETPQSDIFQVAGFDIKLEGTFNGEPFMLSHSSVLENNYPLTGEIPRSHISSFARKAELLDVVPQDQIIIGISAAMEEGELLTTAFIGEHDWRDIGDSDTVVGRVFIGEVIISGERYRIAFDPELNPFNFFEITSVTPIENDENLDSMYDDKLFMVEGSFSCLLSVIGDSDYKEELIIDHFSLIFLNE